MKKNKAPEGRLSMDQEKKLSSCFTGGIVQICEERNKWVKEKLQLISKEESHIKWKKMIDGRSQL